MSPFLGRTLVAIYSILLYLSKSSYLQDEALNNCTICNVNNEIVNCINNQDCLYLANKFNDIYQNKSNSLSITDYYYYYYLNWCSINGEDRFDCNNNGFAAYFQCAVLQRGCYKNFINGQCDSEFNNCINDASQENNCLDLFNYLGDFNQLRF